MVLLFSKEEAEKRLRLQLRLLINKWKLPKPLIVEEDKDVEYLINAFIRYGRECALVRNSRGRITGIVTLFDLLKMFAPRRRKHFILRAPRIVSEDKVLVKDIMSKGLVTVHLDDDLADLLNTMIRYEISHVTVVDDEGKPVAVLSKRIVLKELLGIEKLVEIH